MIEDVIFNDDEHVDDDDDDDNYNADHNCHWIHMMMIYDRLIIDKWDKIKVTKIHQHHHHHISII